MKISNSKRQLAQLLIEAGVTRFPEGAKWAAQGSIDLKASFYGGYKPKRGFGETAFCGDYFGRIHDVQLPTLISNWHQTVLSRDEYSHLYPVAEAIPEPVAEAKPTIEQLVADYRNAKDYAERKRREADDAKADADARLKALELVGEALGLLVSPITAKQELVITDWRDFQVGDEVEAVVPNGGLVKSGELGVIALTDEDKMWVNFQSQKSYIYYKCQFERGDVKFIRRP